MRQPIKWGLILGVTVSVQNFVFGVTGWQAIYSMIYVYLAIAIAINAVTVVLCLRETAAESSWSRQLQNGLGVGLVGSALIFASTWLVTGVVFPEYFPEMAEGYRDVLVGTGLTPQEVEEMVARIAGTSPVRSAFEGLAGTMITSLVVAGVAGIWIRRQEGSPAG